jgi:archaellum component FlaC
MGNIASSAIIGGAFPLLFGQTGAAAVGGAAGGALGGIIGGQFGFALSIAGTAIGQFIQQQDELDKSLSKISRSFQNAGHSVGFTRESFNQMRSTLRMTKDEVIAVATEFARFGEAGQSAAFIFGDNPNTFKNLAAIRDTNTLMTAILDTQNGLSIQQQIQLLREAKITSFKDMQLKVNRMILEENYRRELAEARQITRGDKILDILKDQLKMFVAIKMFINAEDFFPDFFKKSSENMEERVEEITKFYDELLSDLPELQDLLTELDTQVEGMSYSIPSAIDKTAQELRKLTSVGYIVTTTADTIGDAFGESFKGIVKGSMTAQEALRNLFMRTADAFLDMAAQMIAQQIRMKILGIGLRFFGGGTFGTGIPSGANLPAGSFGTGTAGGVGATANDLTRHLANGGVAQANKTYMVGERGPELFTPGATGTVTPNHALGGSTNIVVNVDASGSSVEGDEQQGRELGRLISVAVQSEILQQKRPGGLLA